MINAPDDGIVLYAAGSPIIVDVEESLACSSVPLFAAVMNREGTSFLLKKEKLVGLAELTPEIKARPFLVPLFTPSNRQKAVIEARQRGFGAAFTLVDPSVRVSLSSRISEGVYVNAGCTLGAAGELAEFVFINRGVSLGHHVRLGKFVSIGPGAVICGQVEIGMGTLVGAGAVVLPEKRIGRNSVIAAGAVVTEDVPDHCMVAGNPARIVKQGIAGHGGGSVL